MRPFPVVAPEPLTEHPDTTKSIMVCINCNHK